jgi:hypothetical protein
MKEMLFIMVAVLVPPTLTYLGIVGDSHAQRPKLTWEVPAQEAPAPRPLPVSQTNIAAERQCWPDNAF